MKNTFITSLKIYIYDIMLTAMEVNYAHPKNYEYATPR